MYPGLPFYVPAVAVDTILRDGNVDWLMTHGHKFDDRNQAYELVFNRLAEMGVTILDSPRYFLNAYGFYDVVRDGRILYIDDQHLTVDDESRLSPCWNLWSGKPVKPKPVQRQQLNRPALLPPGKTKRVSQQFYNWQSAWSLRRSVHPTQWAVVDVIYFA